MKTEDSMREVCPVCHEETSHRILLHGRQGYGAIYRCPKCSLARLLPLPRLSEVIADSSGMYKDLSLEFSANQYTLAQRSVDGYLTHLKKLGRHLKSLLDLGGGLGYYCRAFAERGIDVTYVDVDPVSVDFVVKHHKNSRINIHRLPITEFLRIAPHQYDVIFFRHVIEHCTHPDEILRLITRISHSETTLILETDNNLGIELLFHPDAARYWRKVYEDHYEESSILKLCKLRPLAIDSLETHYYAFRPHNLSLLLRRMGWQILDLFQYPLGHSIYWPNLPAASEYQWWRPRRNAHAWIDEAVYCLMYPVLNRLGLISGIAAYAKLEMDGRDTRMAIQ